MAEERSVEPPPTGKVNRANLGETAAGTRQDVAPATTEVDPQVTIAVDIGGTFTDIVLFDRRGGGLRTWKVLTTPHAPEQGVLTGVREALEHHDLVSTDVARLVHATTLVTNAIIERKGVRTGLLTTRGFSDVLDMGREMRYDLYDLGARFPQPLIARQHRHEIGSRATAAGEVLVPTNGEDVVAALSDLEARGVVSLAVCFLHAYARPELEDEVERLARQRFPGLSVSLSSDVARAVGEYDRASTTAANAYVKPVIERYLGRLEDGMAALGVQASLDVMHSGGGFCSPAVARRYPIRLLESGPAAGALAAAHAGAETGRTAVLGFDMGGTTAKACLLLDGQPLRAQRFEAGRVHRFKRGSGLPILATTIDLIEIGAGGGSIAHVDVLGLVQVGPESAASNPGPACYGLGGNAPTVTDADLLLGYLDAASFLGGRMALRPAAAETAVRDGIASRLGIEPLQAAWGIHQVVNENMASAARVYLAEQGMDPRRFTMVATGGAGPVHALGVARSLGLAAVMYPYAAGVGSATGLLVAQAVEDAVQPFHRLHEEVRSDDLEDVLRDLEARVRSRLDGVVPTFSADLRYRGQGQSVTVPLPFRRDGGAALQELKVRFEHAYRTLYGRVVDGASVEIVTVRAEAHREETPPAFSYDVDPDVGGPERACRGRRAIFVPRGASGHLEEVPVYARKRLARGARLAGPCVIEEEATTIVVNVSADVMVDARWNVVVTPHERGRTGREGDAS